jgi:hypothetical protein
VRDFVRPPDAIGEISLEVEEWLFILDHGVWATLSGPLMVSRDLEFVRGRRCRSGFVVVLEWFSQSPASRRPERPAFRDIGLVVMAPEESGEGVTPERARALVTARAWANRQARLLPAIPPYGFRPARRDFLPQGAV